MIAFFLNYHDPEKTNGPFAKPVVRYEKVVDTIPSPVLIFCK